MLASLSDNTIQQYNVTLKLWWAYCLANNRDVLETSISLVLSFLTEQFHKGASYGSLNSHRSALVLFLGDSSISSNESIKRLLKGTFRLRPNLPKYNHTWDPQKVLDYIADWYPNCDLSLEKITKKLVILLAICTAQRVQTLSLVKVDNILISNDGVRILISDIIKTSAAGRQQPSLFLPYFTEKPSICPATAIRDYLSITKDIRPENVRNLLITVKRPHRAATAQSISRWIKQIMGESGVDVTAFSAHSTRHAATSAAAAAGVSIDLIRKTAGWTTRSETFAKFYHRQILTDDIFARNVCRISK
ncbi:hypothetical protein NE865_10710 [Phthorimaea operculella]|nr:hypothetical protein NE865_10710 [Phthorimaea operculella]